MNLSVYTPGRFSEVPEAKDVSINLSHGIPEIDLERATKVDVRMSGPEARVIFGRLREFQRTEDLDRQLRNSRLE